MKQLVIFPSGQLSAKDKERLSKEGYIAVESDDPAKVVMPLPTCGMSADHLLVCASKAFLGGRTYTTDALQDFGKIVLQAVHENSKKPAPCKP